MFLTTNLLYRIPALLIALTLHELAHGYVAYRLGDPTAKNHGRLTLNPLAHLDPLGTLALLFVGFGWARPVPVNPHYLRGDRHRGMFLVGLAGPATNFLLAFIFLYIFAAFPALLARPHIPQIIYTTFIINVYLGVFNLLPIPPLDGSRVLSYFLSPRARYSYNQWEQYGPLLLMLLIFLPIGFLQRVLVPLANMVAGFIITLVSLLTGY
jgi:Zn-dependent protease